MEKRYDSYYEEEKIYKMSFEELSQHEWWTEAMILAYIRHCGVAKLRFLIKTTPPKDITNFGGFAICGGEQALTICRMVVAENDLLDNPLVEFDKNHWYHPYKIKFTSDEFEGVIERFYFSDFCSLLREGCVEIHEVEEGVLAAA